MGEWVKGEGTKGGTLGSQSTLEEGSGIELNESGGWVHQISTHGSGLKKTQGGGGVGPGQWHCRCWGQKTGGNTARSGGGQS